MTEYLSYPDLLRLAIDPSSLYSSKKGMKLDVCQTTGVNLCLANNTRIMDFTAGMRGINLGHNHPEVLSAVAKQMLEYARSAGFFNNHKPINQLWESFLGFIDPCIGSVYFSNTEEEALRYAILLARSITKRSGLLRIKFFKAKQGMKPDIEFLGRDENNNSNSNLYPFTPIINCYISTIDNSELTIESAISELLSHLRDFNYSPKDPTKISAIIIDLVEKDNGFYFPPAIFLSALRCLCNRYGILLIFNERETAFGRTGRMLASQNLEIYSDLTILGKGIANGYSLGCVLIRQELIQGLLEDVWNDIEVDPISCAAALATIDVINTDNLLENCREMGKRLLDGLQVFQKRYPFIEDVRGVGLNLEIKFMKTKINSSTDISAAWNLACSSLQHGLLTYCANSQSDSILLMPPINVTENQIDSALAILEQGTVKFKNMDCFTKTLT
jgi:4-aminobutyrate aminotransferase